MNNSICVFAGDLIGGVVGNLSSIVNLDDESEFPRALFSPLQSPHGSEGAGRLLESSDFSWRHEGHPSELDRDNEEEELHKVQ